MFVVEAVADGFCNNCSTISGDKGKVSLLKISINMSQAPPGCDPEFVACPCCSPVWQQLHQNPMQCPTSSQRRYSSGGNSGRYNSGGRNGANRVELSYGTMSTGYSDNPPPPSTSFSTSSSTTTSTSISTPSTRQYAPFSTPQPSPQMSFSQQSTPTIGSDYMAAASGIGLPKPGRGGRGRGGRSSGRTQESKASSSSGTSLLPSLGPNCGCGVPSVIKTVTKEGENKGRPFYCCGKPRS